MAQETAGAVDQSSQRATGDLGAATAGPWVVLDGPFNILLTGIWTGSVALEASFDGGTTVVPCMYNDGTAVTFSANGHWVAPFATERGMVYRLNRGAGTGTMTWRLSR